MSQSTRRERRNVFLGLAFLAPNILGFLTFTVVPLFFSLAMAFSNWDLKLHNMFKEEPIRFVFFDNFIRLFHERNFWKYLGNTLFFMMGIPLSMAGSLGAALLLSRDTTGGNRRVYRWLLASAVLFVSMVVLALTGLHASAFVILIAGLGGLMLLGGIAGGSTVYRTLFFIPSFTSGVAVYILWKKLYSPSHGPINNALGTPLLELGQWVNSHSPALPRFVAVVLLILMVGTFLFALRQLAGLLRDGSLGLAAALVPCGMVALPVVLAVRSTPPALAFSMVGVSFGLGGAILYKNLRRGRDFVAPLGRGGGDAFMLALALMVVEMILLGLGLTAGMLPKLAAAGLEPPAWLADYDWAKPAIMVMGLWAAIGSNNMLLYLAGLSNIPGELYEAADIDGASTFQRFWHITWPQLAPVTFFIFIMSVIGGLQGGFEMARTMTQGGPFGATTTLSYFIYNEGFTTGRLGYASGIAWTLFAMVFTVTMINWKFGSRYVND
jgi:multiple sugar transport system permease protein